jgi:hypothetical protein
MSVLGTHMCMCVFVCNEVLYIYVQYINLPHIPLPQKYYVENLTCNCLTLTTEETKLLRCNIKQN